MGCCGDKRRELKLGLSNARGKIQEEEPNFGGSEKQKSGEFEYTGNRSLKIKGAVSGRQYYFRYPGHKIIVPYEDVFALMGEADLKFITGNGNRH